MNKLSKSITCPIYNKTFVITFSKKYAKKLSNEDLSTVYGMVFYPPNKYTHVFIHPKYYNAENLCHEAYHLAAHILNDRGVKADFKNQEPMAYLLGWVVDKIDTFHKKLVENGKIK